MARPHPQGRQGEDAASRYLESRGYQIKDRNVRYKGGELDIVAFDDVRHEWVFVEVKSRSSRTFGWPEEDVREKKRSRLKRTAGLYLIDRKIPATAHYRFDIIAIEMNTREGNARIVHYKNIEME